MATEISLETREVAAKAEYRTAGPGDDMPPSAIHIRRPTWKPLPTVAFKPAREGNGRTPASALLTELTERLSAGGYRD